MEKNFTFSATLKYITYGLMIIGIVAIIVGFMSNSDRIWANLLLNDFFFLSLAIGASFFLALQYITQSGWSSAFKRIPEAMSAFIPYGGVIMLIVVFFGMNSIYPWVNPENAGFDDHELHILHNKASTLALTFSLASFDWIMSIDPTWFSTIFALKNFVASFYHGTTVIVIIVLIMHHYGYFGFINDAHWADFSKYVFMLSILWAYFWFSQYLLIWYANIPEETTYYVTRLTGAWKFNFYANLTLNWLVPFLILLPNYFAHKKSILLFVIILVSFGQYTDLFEQIMPGTVGDFQIGFIEVGTWLGFSGLFIYIFARTLSSTVLIPKNHPLLNESIHHSGH